MEDSKKLISSQIEKYIPQHVRMEYPNFVAFIKTYYKWMEEQGAPYEFIANTLNYTDVDRTSLQLLDEFGKNFLSPLPDVIYEQNNIPTLVKNIEQYYSARGSEKAFKFLFRLFDFKDDADHDLEFYYPSYDMLRISDGKWVNDKSIKVIDPDLDTIMEWESGQITGLTSGAKSVVDEVRLYETTSGLSVAEILLIEYDVIHTAEKFICGETVEVITKEENIYTDEIEQVFFKINITDPGMWYMEEQRVHVLNSDTGEDARVIVNTISKGSVTAFTVIDGGNSYQVNDRVYTTSSTGFGSGAYGKVTAIDGGGAITEITLIYGGHDYKYAHDINIDTLNGERAIIFVESTDIGMVTGVEIRDFGINYLLANTTIVFNTMVRVYNIDVKFDIGENITGQDSLAVGVVEYLDLENGLMGVFMTSGEFLPDEEIIGDRFGSSTYVYDISIATGELIDGCVCNYKGNYINKDGHVSSLKYIQDSYFYQMFSYMITTDKEKSEWVDYVKHVHPAGTLGFSFKSITSQYINESYGGFISPSLDTIEFYKFRWQPEPYDDGVIDLYANTQIKQYKDVVIDDIINTNIDILNKTSFCFGSEITIT